VAHAKNAYGLIDIQWKPTPVDEPNLTLRVFDADRDAPELTYRINFSELKRSRGEGRGDGCEKGSRDVPTDILRSAENDEASAVFLHRSLSTQK
jgi:hypothetical protein